MWGTGCFRLRRGEINYVLDITEMFWSDELSIMVVHHSTKQQRGPAISR